MDHMGYFHPFYFLLFILIIGFFIANVRIWRRGRGGCYGATHNNAQVILDKRLASGEVDIEEYKKLKEYLKD